MGKLKKVFSRIFIMVCLMMVFVVNTETVSAAETVTVGDWTYKIDNGVAFISKYNGTSTSVTIPTTATLNGVSYKIKTVGEKAFSGNVTLQKVYIPAEITSLGNAAFKNCTSLSYVEIQGDLADSSGRSIGYATSGHTYDSADYSVFGNAGTNAESFTVKFTDGVTKVPAYLLASSSKNQAACGAYVTKVIIPDTVTEIGQYAFFNCKVLSEVQMGSNITTIGQYAFSNDSALKTIAFGNKVMTLGEDAFSNCTSLKAVTLPASVTTIGQDAFFGCMALEKVELPANKCSIGNRAFKNCVALNSVVIKGDYTDCSGRSIGYATSGHTYNSSDYSVFCNTGTNASSFVVTVENGVTKIPAYLFASSKGSEVELGAHVTKLVIADSVKEIGKCAFYNCVDLSEIQMGSGVAILGESAFNNCKKLENLNLGEGVTTIGKLAFSNSSALKTITFGNKVTTLQEDAFSNCTSLKSVTLPASVTTIGPDAFFGCEALEKVELPANECSLGVRAFKNCIALNSVVIRGNYTDCNDDSIGYSSSGRTYTSSEHSVFGNAGTNANEFIVTVEEGVKRIPAYLFASSKGNYTDCGAHITKVVLADTVEEIGKYAFYNCVDLEEINYSSALTTIGEAAFRYDEKVGEIVLLDTVVNIGKNVFADCSNLRIKGIAESKAEEYAIANGIPFTRAEGWLKIFGKSYWHEGGYRQGTYDDPQGVLGDGTVRGREIYDPISDGWYWLDAVYDGAKAVNKEVWMPYIYQNEATWPEEEIHFNAEASGDMAEQVIREIHNRSGKWVRYDENGKMYKGWYTVEGAQATIYPEQVGNTYYYDHRTGLMAKGEVEIEGRVYYFDEVTGVLQ